MMAPFGTDASSARFSGVWAVRRARGFLPATGLAPAARTSRAEMQDRTGSAHDDMLKLPGKNVNMGMEMRTAAAMRAGGLRSVTGSQDRLFLSGKCLFRFKHVRF
jgi:hypothetical protein